MSFLESTPQTLRAGIVLLDPDNGRVLRIIALQYNPETLTRSLQIRGVGGDSTAFTEALRLKGPPVETIKLEAEIDATDKLETGDAGAAALGLHAQLALLEMLVYPRSLHLVGNNAEARSGSLEIIPMQSPLTLFVWSRTRVLPVRVTEFTITEEHFDAALNPIRAKVSLGMRVLTVDDVGFDHRGGSLFMSYLEQKEQLAAGAAGAALPALGFTGIP